MSIRFGSLRINQQGHDNDVWCTYGAKYYGRDLLRHSDVLSGSSPIGRNTRGDQSL